MDQKPVKSSKGKEKSKSSVDMEAGRFSITGRSKSKAESASESAQDKDAVYSVVSHMERTLFIVDLTKLEAEGDTLIGALVMYRPLYEFKKSQYEQRCSQVIGISLCMKNLTGKYPKFLHMRGTGFAIKGLGSTYIMGLCSRPDEPGACAVECLDTVCNIFRFYYQSPSAVLQTSQGDWEIFTTAMSSIFNSIMDYITADQHSVPAMLKPLPYLPSLKKNQQTYMLSMRVLRTCQKYPPILGGSIMYNSKLVVSQFPPSLMEMLVLIGSGRLELDKKSILEDNIAPGRVWVLEVYLTREEAQLVKDQQKDLSAFQATYASMDVNPNLSNSTLHWRFQSSIKSSKSSTENIKTRKNWRRKSHRVSTARVAPVAASTPNQKPPPKSGSLKSEEAVMFSPGLSSVSFNHNHVKNSAKPQFSSSAGSPSHTGNDTDELYLDAVDIDPTAAIGPEMLRLFSRSSSQPSGGRSCFPSASKTSGGNSSSCTAQEEAGGGKPREFESQVHGTGSTSSEGFATPSPTPPRMSSIAASQLLPMDDSAMTCSFKTACDLSQAADEGEGSGEVAASRGHKTTPTGPTDETRTQNTSQNVPGANDQHRIDFGERNNSESDEDFVDSEDLDKILARVAKEKKTNRSNAHSYSPPTNRSNAHSYSPPPPIPKRGAIAVAPPIHASAAGISVDAPPTPPARGNSTRNIGISEETKKEETPPPPVPPRLQVHSAEVEPMLSGVLDHPEGYPYLPVKEGEVVKGKKLVQLQSGLTGSAQPRNTWIYDTLKRCDKYTVPGGESEVCGVNGVILHSAKGEDGGRARVTGDSHETTPMPAGAVGERTERKGRFDDKDYADINEDTETRHPKQDISTRRPTKSGDDYEEIDDDVLDRVINKTRPSQDVSPRPAKPMLDKEIDDEVMYQVVNDVSTQPAKLSDKNCVKIGDVLTEVGTENSTSAHLAASKPLRDYYRELGSEAGDKLANVGVTSEHNTVSAGDEDRDLDIGNAALYLEHDDELHDTDESKNSSMTVTLDLSHIAKEDIMYGSRDKKGGSSVDLSRISIENDESSAEETGGDGTVTPIEMTYNESMLHGALLKAKLEQHKRAAETQRPLVDAENRSGTESGLNDSGEYSSLPDEDENVFVNTKLEDDSAISKAREKTKTWLSRTIDRKNVGSSEEKVLEKYCVYVQQYMNTYIILLSDPGLQHQHGILNQLWRLLAEQLISVDMVLDEKTKQAAGTSPKTTACMVSYSSYEHLCEALPQSAAYHFRHAVRRAHQEYLTDPSLCQISLSKEHCRVLSQRVHDREIYYQPGKLSGDALSLHGVLERQAKWKCSLRQQPIGGPKIMFI